MTIDRTFFFQKIRPEFGGKFEQTQVDGLNYLLDAWEGNADTDLRWLAYCLGTAKHETGGTMQPIKERGGDAYFFRMYDPQSPNPARADLAKRTKALPGDGIKYPGRGYVQLTWRENYKKASALTGLPLESNPDLAMQPGPAAKIMFAGMRVGLFTGKKLTDYFPFQAAPDWLNARRIINGTDCAEKVADHAKAFYSALVG